jgi:hypothetical protein
MELMVYWIATFSDLASSSTEVIASDKYFRASPTPPSRAIVSFPAM